jgi:hypothetical protein
MPGRSPKRSVGDGLGEAVGLLLSPPTYSRRTQHPGRREHRWAG